MPTPEPTEVELAECPVDTALSVFAGRWKGTILWRLEAGPMRTGELRRSIPGVSEQMLIRHLKELVADGLVARDAEPVVPPKVTYRITDYGRTLAPVLWQLCDWGRRHAERSLVDQPSTSRPVSAASSGATNDN